MKRGNVSYSPGVFGLLGVAFVVLRLCGVIEWSWFWVLSPFWAPLVLMLVVLILIVGFLGKAKP